MKSTLMRTAETKFVSSYAGDTTPNVYTSVNSTITGATQFGFGLPSLFQGTGSYARQGDSITPRQTKVLLDVRLTPTGAPVDLTVVLYYGYCKKYTKFTDVVANSFSLCNELLRLGGVNASGDEEQSFNGIQSDSHLLVNTDVWHLKKITFRLNKCPGVLNGAGAGVLSQGNKNTHAVLLDYSSMCPATLKYNTSTDDEPENWAPIWTMGYYYNDATPPDTGLTGAIQYKANRMLTYKDF